MTQPAARIMMPTGGLRRRLGRPRLASDESQTPRHGPKPAATRGPGGPGVACKASAAAKQPLDPHSDSDSGSETRTQGLSQRGPPQRRPAGGSG
jgi:hypothetical protein